MGERLQADPTNIRMQKISFSASGFFNVRSLLAFSLCGVSALLAIASFAGRSENATAATTTSGARIYVTTTAQKIGEIGSGGCCGPGGRLFGVLPQRVIRGKWVGQRPGH